MNLNQQTYSISELTRMIRERIDQDQRLQDIWIKGEISNFTHHRRGHMYFSLKDASSKIKAVMFASHNRSLAFQPEDGMNVLARGYVSVYERDGQYQFYVLEMQPDGFGSLFLAFEQLKKRLESEGLFSPARKKPLPPYPRVIGVITSLSGAAIRDILTTIQRRYPIVRVIIAPVEVQGSRAVPSIVHAIQMMNQQKEADVLIVGRGGGSIEELWAFNEEAVARAIYASEIPIISAVGHETDVTIADFVADVRAATPTAAAELAVPSYSELVERIGQMKVRLKRAISSRLQQEEVRLKRICQYILFRRPESLLLRQEQRLDHLLDRLRFTLQSRLNASASSLQALQHRLAKVHPGHRLKQEMERLRYLQYRLNKGMEATFEHRRHRLSLTLRHLDALSPLKVMQRGYALVRSEEGQLVLSTEQVALGDLVQVQLRDGILDCQVYRIDNRPLPSVYDTRMGENGGDPGEERGESERFGRTSF